MDIVSTNSNKDSNEIKDASDKVIIVDDTSVGEEIKATNEINSFMILIFNFCD